MIQMKAGTFGLAVNGFVKAMTKDKIVSIALNNSAHISEFPDSVASFVAYMIQVVFTLVTVFISNYWAGIIVALLGVVNFFVYYKFNKKLGYHMLERNETNDNIYITYNKIITPQTEEAPIS